MKRIFSDKEINSIKNFLLLVIMIIFILFCIRCYLSYLDQKYGFRKSIQIDTMKRDYKDRFNYEMKNQYDTEVELYVIMPEHYGRQEIDNFAEELGNRYDYNLIFVEFRYNHVIYKYRKKF